MLDALTRSVDSKKRPSSHSIIADAVIKVGVALKAIEDQRLIYKPMRRAQYEEAVVLRNAPFEERTILKRIPGDVAFGLSDFMGVFCEYFETDGVYDHELARAIASLEISLAIVNERLQEGTTISGDFVADIRERIYSPTLISTNENKWGKLARAYFQLKKILMEYGVKG